MRLARTLLLSAILALAAVPAMAQHMGGFRGGMGGGGFHGGFGGGGFHGGFRDGGFPRGFSPRVPGPLLPPRLWLGVPLALWRLLSLLRRLSRSLSGLLRAAAPAS